jgi:hypothetical protein
LPVFSIVYIVGITFLKEASEVAAAPVEKQGLFANAGIPQITSANALIVRSLNFKSVSA